MTNKLKSFLVQIVIIVSVACLVSNIIVFRAYVIQQQSVVDMNNIVPKMTIDEAEYNDLRYPNINIFTVPFKTALARVYARDSLYEKAITTFHEARKNNPYLMINENYLAQTYLTLGKKDSFKYYAKKIFKTAPNHSNHFAFFIKSLDSLKSSFKIDSSFSIIKKKSINIWRIYLASIYNADSLTNTALENIKIADSLYKFDSDIQYLVSVLRNGQENVKKSEEFISISDAFAKNENFKASIKSLKEALKYNPINNITFDKLATSYFKIEQYDSSLLYLNKINIEKYENLGRYHLIKGINLVNLNNKDEGCKEIFEAVLLGNKEAIKANRSFCN